MMVWLFTFCSSASEYCTCVDLQSKTDVLPN